MRSSAFRCDSRRVFRSRAVVESVQSLEPRRLFAAISWDGGAGTLNWSDAANWSTNTLPGVNDDVTINIAGTPTVTIGSAESPSLRSLTSNENLRVDGTLQFAQTSSIAAGLSLAGVLVGNDTLTVNTLNWTAGEVNSATLAVTGAATLSPVDGGAIYMSESARLRLQGSSTLNASSDGTGALLAGSDTMITVAAGATFILHGNAISNPLGGNAVLNVDGTLRADVSGAEPTVGLELAGTGAIDVAAGDLHLTGGTAHDDEATVFRGLISIVSGATLQFLANTFDLGTVTSTGAGLLEVIGGSTVNFNAAATLNTPVLLGESGVLSGSGTVEATGAFDWNSGAAMFGTGTTRIDGALHINSLTDRVYLSEERHVIVVSTATLASADGNAFAVGGNTLLQIEPGATMNMLDGSSIIGLTGGPVLNNAGTISVAGTSGAPDAATINIYLENHGVVDVHIGSLHLADTSADEGGFLSGGIYNADFDASLYFDNGLTTLTASLEVVQNSQVFGLENLDTNLGSINVGNYFSDPLTFSPALGVFHQFGIIQLFFGAKLNIVGDCEFGGSNDATLKASDASKLHVTGSTTIQPGVASTLNFDSVGVYSVGWVHTPLSSDMGTYGNFRTFIAGPQSDGNSMRYLHSGASSDVNVVVVAGPAPAAPRVLSGSYEYLTRQAVTLTFDQDVSTFFDAYDVRIVNRTTNATFLSQSVSYNVAANSATLLLTNQLTDGNYDVVVSASDIANAAGVIAQAGVSFSFFALRGDINHDRHVDFSDLLLLAQNYGAGGRDSAHGNIDYSTDGSVNFNDLLNLAQQYGKSIAAPSLLLPIDAAGGGAKRRQVAAGLIV
jgi:hypothetical protein